MTKPKRRIKSAQINLISLVPAGANRVQALFKGQDTVEVKTISKFSAEGVLTSLVYSPGVVDSQGDVADADVVKQMAHDFISNMRGSGIDVLHDCEPLNTTQARICETFIVQKGDPRFAGIKTDDGKPLDPTGSWGIIIKIDDPNLIAKYATGEWVGVSMFGSAIVEPINKSQQKEQHMDPQAMAELLKQFGAELSTQIVAGLAKALTPKEPAQNEPAAQSAVPFDGDPFNPEDLAKHADKVLLASLDLSKPADLKKWQDHVAAKKAPAKPADETAAKIAELEKTLAKLRGASNAPAGDPTSGEGELTVAQKIAKGRERAQELRKQGFIR